MIRAKDHDNGGEGDDQTEVVADPVYGGGELTTGTLVRQAQVAAATFAQRGQEGHKAQGQPFGEVERKEHSLHVLEGWSQRCRYRDQSCRRTGRQWVHRGIHGSHHATNPSEISSDFSPAVDSGLDTEGVDAQTFSDPVYDH